jgi:heterodisulfide reductase subunit A
MIQALTDEATQLSQDKALREEASRLLQDGYDGIVGLRKKWGHVGPYLFSQVDEIQDLVLEPRYPLAKIICLIQRKWPDKKLGAVVRGCDERALEELEKRGIFNKDGFAFLGIICSQEQADECNCEKPAYHTFDCTGCWKCIEKCKKEAITRINVCPIVRPNEFDLGLANRKAIYVPFPQAVPNKATRDAEHCLKLIEKLDCKGCTNVCEPGAINHEMEEEIVEVDVGNIIVATGFDSFDPSAISHYGYGKYDNVITGLQFERMANASGPTDGEIVLRNGNKPESVAIIHCVGSRDKNYNAYCSQVCCMHSLKHAHLIKERTGADIYQMYIDIRCAGKGYEEFYERVSEEGVNFIRGKVAQVTNHAINEEEKGKLIVECEDTLLSSTIRVPVDMVILSTALEPRTDAETVGQQFNIGRSADGFFLEKHPKMDPVAAMNDGVFVVGCAQGPKDIPQSITQASAAAARALATISKGYVELEPCISQVIDENCDGCAYCVDPCPFDAITLVEYIKDGSIKKTVQSDPVKCHGCGICQATCPKRGIAVKNFNLDQIQAMVNVFVDST